MSTSKNMPETGGNDVVRRALLDEAARMDASLEIHDAQTLRLYALKQDAEAAMRQLPEGGRPELALIPGEVPRLWVDLIGSVSMAPDPRTYRFEVDGEGSRELILETRNREDMAAAILDYAARRMIARARAVSGRSQHGKIRPQGYSAAALMLAWLSGLALGIFGILAFLAGRAVN